MSIRQKPINQLSDLELSELIYDKPTITEYRRYGDGPKPATLAEQINAVLQDSHVTIYSLSKTMGCTESENKRLHRYLNREGKSLPTGGVQRVAEALSQLCGKEIFLME